MRDCANCDNYQFSEPYCCGKFIPRGHDCDQSGCVTKLWYDSLGRERREVIHYDEKVVEIPE